MTDAFRLRATRLSWLAAFTVIVPKPDAVFEVVMYMPDPTLAGAVTPPAVPVATAVVGATLIRLPTKLALIEPCDAAVPELPTAMLMPLPPTV